MPHTFLSAEWRKLIMANYVVSPALLEPYLPQHTVLDTFNGACYVSLVGFLFQDVRLRGFRVPFHMRFEEVNLRFYVRHLHRDGRWRRGVVFIREFVPLPALSIVANTLYGEHYQTLRMRHKWRLTDSNFVVSYRWRMAGRWQKLQVNAMPRAQRILENSEEEFISEHYWGYTRTRRSATSEYEVTHPRWDVYPVKGYDIDVDFGLVYGKEFELLNHLKPSSVFLAEGSEITVQTGSRIVG